MSYKPLNIRETTYSALLTYKLDLQVKRGEDLSFSDVIDDLLAIASKRSKSQNHRNVKSENKISVEAPSSL